jgi:hypothetical protein
LLIFAAILRSKARFGLTSLHAVITLAGFPAAGNGDYVAQPGDNIIANDLFILARELSVISASTPWR